MPDDDTLNAIGVRSIPAWYIAAHPMKARERGFGRGSGAADRIWGARREPFPATGPNSSQMPFRTQPPVFHQPSASRFTSKPSAEFFGAPSGYSSNFMRPPFVSPVGQHAVFDRVNGLPDQTQPQYHYTACSRGMELAIMRKPPKPKTPGYNTHPFQLPPPPSPQDSATVPELEKPQLKPVPVWEPRQSKLSNALVHRAGHSTSTMNKDGAAAQGQGQTSVQLEKDDAKLDTSTPSATDGEKQQLKVDDAISHHPPPSHSTVYHPASATPTSLRTRPSAINVAYPSLQPSLPLQSTSAALPSRERQSSVSSDLFALAPKTPAPPHRRLFVAPGEERYVTEAEEPQAIKVRPSVNDQGGSLRFQERAQKPYRKERQVGGNGKADRLKNLLDNNVNKKRVFSPEKTPRGKQAVKEGGQSKELLVDI